MSSTLGSRRAKAAIALLLTLAAGCVDIVGFLTLYHIFTAHMTGATVHVSASAVEAHWIDAWHGAVVIVAFTAGSIVGRGVIEYGARKRVRSIASATLLLEAFLIAAVILGMGDGGRSVAWAILLASAMGLQTATLTRVGSLTVHTTFVTGMLNKFAQLISHAAFISYDRIRGRMSESGPAQAFRQAGFIFSVWMMYLAGAAIGSSLVPRWQIRTLLLPLCTIVAAIVMDQVIPLSIEEERDEVEPGRMFPRRENQVRAA